VLLDSRFIRAEVTGEDEWARSHGAEPETAELGAGILYYALAYATRASVCLCLGSGGGYVPRLMRQAQRDLGLEGARTILVDGAEHVPDGPASIWGTPAWRPDDSWFRRRFPDVEIVLALTEPAFRERFAPEGLTVDYLHIDADHAYDGVRRDWELYSTLVAPEGVITLHDTQNRRPPCGVPQLLEEIRREGRFDAIDFPVRYGTAVLKRRPPPP
jgi:hypothetical protein